MSDETGFPQKEELRKLSRQSLVSYAVRCALRVQPLLATWKKATREYKTAVLHIHRDINQLIDRTNTNFPLSMRIVVAVFETKKALESSKGMVKASDAFNAAKAISNAAHVFDLAMNSDTDEFQIIDAAFEASADSFVASTVTAEFAAATNLTARADYNLLYNSIAEVVDASETGPLGDLWHGSPPEWYIDAKEQYDKTIADWERELGEEKGETGNISGSAKVEVSASAKLTGVISDDTDFPIEFYIDPGDARKETIQNVLECLSDLHIAAGGFGLEFIADDLNIKAMEGITK